MSEIEFIVDQLRRAFDGEAWHGPALMEILDGMEASTAARHPVAGAHSTWELVLHVAAWERVITRRLEGEALVPADEENFPPIPLKSAAAWQEALERLRAGHEELIRVVSSLPESRLGHGVPGKDYDIRFMLAGAVAHAAYHGGQMALLKKSCS
jgi:uncharacterized damage-inducible protein DinB